MKIINTFIFVLFLVSTLGAQSNELLSKNAVAKMTLHKPVAEHTNSELVPLLNLNIDNKLELVYREKDKKSNLHHKYHQSYKGLKVIGGTLVIHEMKNGVSKVTGSAFKGDMAVEPLLSEEKAKQIGLGNVLNSIRKSKKSLSSVSDLNTEDIELVIARKKNKNNSNYRLAYQIKIIGKQGEMPIRQETFIDANNREFLFSNFRIQENSIKGSGSGFHNKEVTFDVDSIAPGQYVLEDYTRGKGIMVFDHDNNEDKFTDDDNVWDDGDIGQQTAVDAFYGAQKFYDFLQGRFDRNSIDDQGFPLKIVTNCPNLVNAFWNGEESVFGNGNCTDAHPLTTLDVVGHEITHGLTEFTSNLIYQGESGALNEAMSDIFGKALDRILFPKTLLRGAIAIAIRTHDRPQKRVLPYVTHHIWFSFPPLYC